MMRPTPFNVESERLGSTQTNTAPSGDSLTQVGYIATGGPANRVTLKPVGALKSAWSFCSTAGSRGTVPDFAIGCGRAVDCAGAWAPSEESAANDSSAGIVREGRVICML